MTSSTSNFVVVTVTSPAMRTIVTHFAATSTNPFGLGVTLRLGGQVVATKTTITLELLLDMDQSIDFSKLYSFASVDNLRKTALKRICCQLGIHSEGLGRKALVNVICNHLQISTYSSSPACSTALQQSSTSTGLDSSKQSGQGEISLKYLQQLKDWTKSLAGFPLDLDIHIVKSHLLGNGHKHDEVNKYKTTRAWNQKEGVHSLRFHTLPDQKDQCAIRASCNPSMSTDDNEVKLVFIVLNSLTAQPIFTHCTCTIGLRKDCSHVGAVLFVLCDIVAEGHQELPSDPTCTDLKCKWVDPKSAHCEPKLVADINIFKASFGKEPPTKRSKTIPTAEELYVNVCNEKQLLGKKIKLRDDILSANKSDCLPPIVHLLPSHEQIKECNPYFTIAPEYVQDVNLVYLDEVELDHSTEVMVSNRPLSSQLHNSGPLSLQQIWENVEMIEKSLQVTPEERDNIERATCGQDASKDWFYHRRPRITASQCKRALLKRSKSPTKALREILDFQPGYCSAAMQDGKTSEQSIIAAYCHKTKYNVQKCGFFISQDNPYLGASPDGLVGDEGLVEVKKIHPHKSESLVEALIRLGICKRKNGIPVVNLCHKYYYQMQQQMFCTKRHWCDFVASDGQNLYIYRVRYDNSFFLSVIPSLELFFKNYILIELAYPRVKLGLPRLGKLGVTYELLKN